MDHLKQNKGPKNPDSHLKIAKQDDTKPGPSAECFHVTSWHPYWCNKTMKQRQCCCTKPIRWELNSSLM